MLGYFFLDNETVLMELDKHRFLLLFLFALGIGLTTYFNRILSETVSWLFIRAILGMARHYLNGGGDISRYLSKNSFGIYLFHQSWIVILGFFILQLTLNVWGQILLIIVGSVLLTWAINEIARRVPALRWMLGLKK